MLPMYKILFLVIIITFAAAIGFAVFLLLKFSVRFIRFLRKHNYKAEKFGPKYGLRYAKVVSKKFANFKEKVDRGEIELHKITSPFLNSFLNAIEAFKFLYSFPIFIIRMIIGFFNPKFLWWIPFNLYEIWHLLLIGCSFSLSAHSHIGSAMFIAISVALFSLTDIIDYFRHNKKGVMKIISIPKHKLRIFEIVCD